MRFGIFESDINVKIHVISPKKRVGATALIRFHSINIAALSQKKQFERISLTLYHAASNK
jgi:hypothetical protein